MLNISCGLGKAPIGNRPPLPEATAACAGQLTWQCHLQNRIPRRAAKSCAHSQRRTDAAMKAGLRPSMVRFTATLTGCAGVVPEGRTPMWERTTVTVTVKLNVALCLFGIAAIIHALT